MTADEIRKNLHAASVHLSQHRKTGDYRYAILAMIFSDLYGAEEECGKGWTDANKVHIAWLLASASIQAMEIIGKYTPEDAGLDKIHSGEFHKGSQWSRGETEKHIVTLRKIISRSSMNEGNEAVKFAQLIGECRSICEGIGQDLFGTIEWAIAQPES